MPTRTSTTEPMLFRADFANSKSTVMTVKDLFTAASRGTTGALPAATSGYFSTAVTVPLFFRSVITIGVDQKGLVTEDCLDPVQGQCALVLFTAAHPSTFLLFYHIWSGITDMSIAGSIKEMGANAADVYAILFWPKAPSAKSDAALKEIMRCITDGRQVLLVSDFCSYNPVFSFQCGVAPDQTLGGMNILIG